MDNPAHTKPQIEQVQPGAAIAGGEIAIRGRGLAVNGNRRPVVRFGERTASLLVTSPHRLVVRVPEGAASGPLTVESEGETSPPASVAIATVIAENLHPVANPVVDAAGNIYTTFSGSRGQKTPVSVYKIDSSRVMRPFLKDLMNATGLAQDGDGILYVSSRMDGTVYQVTPDGERSLYAQGMGVATGIAFDGGGNLYVGDRSGTIFKIGLDRQIFVFATIEPSVAAYHLAFGPDSCLYVSGPTTSSFDHVYRVNPAGEVSSFFRGLGRPQGIAFDKQGNLYVAGSFEGQRGVVRVSPNGNAELVISGSGIVGLAITHNQSMILATNNSLLELFLDIERKPQAQ